MVSQSGELYRSLPDEVKHTLRREAAEWRAEEEKSSLGKRRMSDLRSKRCLCRPRSPNAGLLGCDKSSRRGSFRRSSRSSAITTAKLPYPDVQSEALRK